MKSKGKAEIAAAEPEEEEPADTRGPFKQFSDALYDVIKNPTARWVTIGGMFRFWETFSIVYFLPAFFQKNFPTYKVEYGLYNALIVSSMGFISTVAGGLISDKYEKRSRMTKALVCLVGSALAIPAISLCVLNPVNFYRALFFMGIKFLVSECWMSPAITMMQNTVSPKE